jgi:hypothetical protein
LEKLLREIKREAVAVGARVCGGETTEEAIMRK